MPQLCIRLRDEDKRKLEKLEEKLGKNTTDVIRDLIQNGYDRQAVTEALRQLMALASSQAAVKRGNNDNGDIAEIKRIVTLIGRAMPSVAKNI